MLVHAGSGGGGRDIETDSYSALVLVVAAKLSQTILLQEELSTAWVKVSKLQGNMMM